MRKTKEQVRQEALSRATSNLSVANYPSIYQGFLEKGIAEPEIQPRVNIFTYEAWRALGRHVRKGEHGVRVLTRIDCEKKDKDEEKGEETIEKYSRPWKTTVFHVSQTDPDSMGGAR